MSKFAFKWDAWQQTVLDHDGNITIRSGRQVGKSEVISEKASRLALSNPGSTILIIAASQRQSSLLFEKVTANISRREELERKKLYAEKPTLTRVLLRNKSRIYALPAGRTGYFIRGFTIDWLIADEAAYIPEQVWLAVIPMLAVSRKVRGFGFQILLSTPFGKGGYFYDSFTDPDFKSFHVSSEDCSRIPLKFLQKEKARLTKAQYAQEYLGEFLDEWNQFFSSELIKKCMTFIEWKKSLDFNPRAKYYLGVDIARYGGDENAYVICELFDSKLKIVRCFTTERASIVDTIGRILVFDQEFGFSKIFIDDGGLGGGVLDLLQEKLGRRAVGLNNASKRLQVQGEEKKRGILKEDLYSNALKLMECGKVSIISDLGLLRSLKSITFQYGSDNDKNSRLLKIFGDYSHLAEAFVRACWCIKESGLNIYLY